MSLGGLAYARGKMDIHLATAKDILMGPQALSVMHSNWSLPIPGQGKNSGYWNACSLRISIIFIQ